VHKRFKTRPPGAPAVYWSLRQPGESLAGRELRRFRDPGRLRRSVSPPSGDFAQPPRLPRTAGPFRLAGRPDWRRPRD